MGVRGMFRWLVIASAFAVFVSGCTRFGGDEAPREENYPQALLTFKADVQGALNQLDADLFKASRRIAELGLDSPETRALLNELLAAHPYVLDATTVNAEGVIVAAEPEAFRGIEGADISQRKYLRRLIKRRGPVFSEAFWSPEGNYGVDLEWPVVSQEDGQLGSVGLFIRPEVLLAELVQPVTEGLPVDAWVMESEGMCLYDPDPEEIGRNILDDPIYGPFPDLRRLARQMSKRQSGSGQYAYLRTGTQEEVSKTVHWTSVELHGTEWRLALVQVEDGDGGRGHRNFSDLELMQHRDGLRRLANDEEFLRLLSLKRRDSIERLLQDFHENHPDLYAVQWIDTAAVTRFGVPRDRSLDNYDHKTGRNPNDAAFVEAVKKGVETWQTEHLSESGEKGVVYLTPLRQGLDYYGMLYFVRILPD